MTETEEIKAIADNFREALRVYRQLMDADVDAASFYQEKLIDLGWNMDTWDILWAEIEEQKNDQQ